MKHLKLKNLRKSSVNKPPSSAAKYIAVSDTCDQVVHDEARAIPNQKYHENVNLVSKFYGYLKLKASAWL